MGILQPVFRPLFSPIMRRTFGDGGSEGASAPWTPASLYAASEQGTWLSLRDESTLFTDAARTTPAAAGGQIGGITDKSGNGAHAAQATSSFRPGWPATGPATFTLLSYEVAP